MTRPTDRTTEHTRTVDELITELAACAVVPHYDDLVQRHDGLYGALCDAVTDDGNRTAPADFCERCQPAYLRVDEDRNAELVDRERMVFRLGIQIGQRAQGGTFEPGSSTADDTAPRDVVPIGRQFTAAELMEARRPTLEDVLDEANRCPPARGGAVIAQGHG